MQEWVKYAVSILSSLAVAIPLVVSLINYVKKAIQERGNLMKLVMNLMSEAEKKFDNGADRKEWVIAMVQASASTINYPVDINALSDLIDKLCTMSKAVNPPASTAK